MSQYRLSVIGLLAMGLGVMVFLNEVSPSLPFAPFEPSGAYPYLKNPCNLDIEKLTCLAEKGDVKVLTEKLAVMTCSDALSTLNAVAAKNRDHWWSSPGCPIIHVSCMSYRGQFRYRMYVAPAGKPILSKENILIDVIIEAKPSTTGM
jgi:hypothetical protein